jgi:hypothetical protein
MRELGIATVLDRFIQNHDALMGKLAKRIEDRRLLGLVRRVVREGVRGFAGGKLQVFPSRVPHVPLGKRTARSVPPRQAFLAARVGWRGDTWCQRAPLKPYSGSEQLRGAQRSRVYLTTVSVSMAIDFTPPERTRSITSTAWA